MEENENKMNYKFSHHYIDNIFGALTLISIGVVFLLNTTGNLSWSVWSYIFLIFFSIWPIFLILAGIQIIFDQYWLTKILGSLLGFLVFAVVVIISIGATNNPSLADQIRNQSWATNIFGGRNIEEKNITVSSEKYSDLESRNLNLELTAGQFNLKDEGDNYFSVNSKYTEKFGEPQLIEVQKDKDLKLNFNQKTSDGFWFGPFWSQISYDMKIGKPELKTDLKIKMTAGEGDINLTDLSMNNFDLNMTAGDLTASFGEKSLPKNMDIKLTAGDFNLNLPENTGLEITFNKTAGNISVNGKDLENEDKTFSLNNDSQNKIKININITAGDINIKTK